MFGGVAAKVNGQMFAGLFARGAVVKLSEVDQKAALAIDGAAMFDPMGNGRVMRDTVFLPESVMVEPDELRAWIQKALDFTASLPAKKKRPATKAAAKKPSTAKAPFKRPAARKTKSRASRWGTRARRLCRKAEGGADASLEDRV
jgi:TfoX/Sxy family transcriptional regulator of competence genes